MSVTAGLYLTNQYHPSSDPRAALDGQLAMVRAARDGGWEAIFAGHHYLGDQLAHFQPLPVLARASAEAEGMRIGTGIWLLALHNPLDVAEQMATLDVISRGRFTFGVGLGYRDVEYAAFGIGKRRIGRFEENLAIIRRLWAGEAVTADLPWCRLDQARLTTLPIGQPPIWMAANSDSAVERAARIADAWMINPHATLDTIRRQLTLYTAARVTPASGLPLFREIFCGPDRETALRRAEPFLAAKYQTYASWGQHKVMPDQDAFDQPYAALADQRFIVGSPEDCVAALQPWLELGVSDLVLRTHWAGMPTHDAVESIQLISTDVLPALRRA